MSSLPCTIEIPLFSSGSDSGLLSAGIANAPLNMPTRLIRHSRWAVLTPKVIPAEVCEETFTPTAEILLSSSSNFMSC
jgi:hypothetical protein